jgi:hypothetical protein
MKTSVRKSPIFSLPCDNGGSETYCLQFRSVAGFAPNQGLADKGTVIRGKGSALPSVDRAGTYTAPVRFTALR